MQATKTSSIMVMIGQIDNEIKNKIGWVIQQNKLSLKPIKDKKQEPLWDTLSTRRWSNTVTDEVANEARIGKGLDIINPMHRHKSVQKLKTDRLTQTSAAPGSPQHKGRSSRPKTSGRSTATKAAPPGSPQNSKRTLSPIDKIIDFKVSPPKPTPDKLPVRHEQVVPTSQSSSKPKPNLIKTKDNMDISGDSSAFLKELNKNHPLP